MDRGMFIGLIFCLAVIWIYAIVTPQPLFRGWDFFVFGFPGIAVGVAGLLDEIRKKTRAKRLDVSVRALDISADNLRQLIAENNISGAIKILEELDLAVRDITIYQQGDSSKLWRTLLKNRIGDSCWHV